jgi:long-subunit fatty acid transport protein
MPALTIPSGKKFAFGMDVSTYDGTQGIGAALAYKVNRTWSIDAGLGGSFQGGPLGARAGVRAAW